MIVYARDVGNRLKHACERGLHLILSHSHAQLDFLGFCPFGTCVLGQWFHREMQQDLIAAMVGFLGDFCREREVRQNGNCQRERQRKERVGGGAIVMMKT